MSGTPIDYVNSTDIQLVPEHGGRPSSPLIFLQNTRCSSHTYMYHFRRQKLRCRRAPGVEQCTGYYKRDHQQWTVYATSENTFIQDLEIAAHCDS